MSPFLLRLAIYSAITVLVPLGFLWFLRKKVNLGIKLGVLVFVGTMIVIGYPIFSFSLAFEKVDSVFEGDCVATTQYSRQFINHSYSKFHSDLIGKLFGFTPKFYFLETIAICEYKMGNISEAVRTLEETISYGITSPYDQARLDNPRKLLDQARRRLNQ